MDNKAILMVIITAASTLLGVLITQYFELLKRKSEEKRWYADYFLTRKIDALNNLFKAMIDWHFVLNFYGNYPPPSLKDFREKILPKENAYLGAKVVTSIYLSNEEEKIMADVLGSFRQVTLTIFKNLSKSAGTKIDWDKFENSYDEATNCLRNKLNPKILERIEPS